MTFFLYIRNLRLNESTYFLISNLFWPTAPHRGRPKKNKISKGSPQNMSNWYHKRFGSKIFFIPGGPKNIFWKSRSTRACTGSCTVAQNSCYIILVSNTSQGFHWYHWKWSWSGLSLHFGHSFEKFVFEAWIFFNFSLY